MNTNTANRAASLDQIRTAIESGRAYLKTFAGRKLVTAYDHSTGWATTNNGTSYLDQQSFMVCADDILIAAEPIRATRRVASRSGFDFQGKRVEVCSSEIVVAWNWPEA